MKMKILKSYALSLTLMFAANINISFAKTIGGDSGGGGDQYTLDFIKIATQSVFPWISENGSKLSPSVDANDFILAVNPKDISSLDKVYESCDGSQRGREVSACYNYTTDKIFLSRTLYPLNINGPAKIGLVAHEIFRKMGIEGDGYEVTKQMPITNTEVKIKIKMLKQTQTFSGTGVASGIATDAGEEQMIRDLQDECTQLGGEYAIKNMVASRKVNIDSHSPYMQMWVYYTTVSLSLPCELK